MQAVMSPQFSAGIRQLSEKMFHTFLVEHALPHQLDRAQAQTLLEHLVVPHIDAARRIAADIRAMNEGPREAQQAACHEQRLEQVNVVEVHDHAARGVRVVGHHHVAGLPVIERLGCRRASAHP